MAIVLDAAALIVWDIGTRSPFALWADVRAGLRDRRSLVRGLSRFAVGGIALLGSTLISVTLVARAIDFTVVGVWALVCGLLVEQLIGNDTRAFLAMSAKPQSAGRPINGR